MPAYRLHDLPIIPAQRSIRPLHYKPPVEMHGGRVLRTCSGLLIGSASGLTDCPRTDGMSRDEERTQRALLDPRTAPTASRSLVSRVLNAVSAPLVFFL